MFGILEPGKIGLNFREKLEGCGGIDPISGGRFALPMRHFGGSGVSWCCARVASMVSYGRFLSVSCSAPHRAGRSMLAPSGDRAPIQVRSSLHPEG